MIAKFGVVFPSTSFVALGLGGVFSNTVHYCEGSFVHVLKGLVNLRSFVSTFEFFLCFPDQIFRNGLGCVKARVLNS